MAAKSKAQLRKIFELERQGLVKPGTGEEFALSTPKDVPERVPRRPRPRRR